MKIYNDFKIKKLPKGMQCELDFYRASRQFSVKKYMEKKVEIINKYFSTYNLKTAIIAISGGVDSAVSLALIKEASKQKDSNIKNIVPIFIPAYDSYGVTGQKEAYVRAKELCDSFNLEMKELDISAHVKTLSQDIQGTTHLKSDNWSEGQLIPYLRTTALYYFTTLYTQNGQKAVIVGTTNADEGQYIGYFGKASDGLVDLQIISDIHKSEVYAIAKYLKVPKSIQAVIPTGDMYDGRVDEDVFGFPYAFIELYRYYSNMESQEKNEMLSRLQNPQEVSIFEELTKNVENMHTYNKHKYLGCSPAVHLDVIETRMPNGWNYSNWSVQ